MVEKQRLLCFGPFRLEPKTCILRVKNEVVRLEPKVGRTLLALVQAKGHPVDKEALISEVWEGVAVTDNSLARNISLLRTTLERYLPRQRCIETIPTIGYSFVLPVTEAWETTTAPFDTVEDKLALETGEHHADEIGSGASVRWPQIRGDDCSPPATGKSPAPLVKPFARQAKHWFRGIPMYMIPVIGLGVVLLAFILPPSSPTVIDSTQLTHENRELGCCLFTDGSYVFFSEMLGDRQEIAKVPVHAGETTVIPTPFRLPHLVGIFPDKTALIIADNPDSSRASLWRLPLQGGPLQPLEALTALHTFHFSFSPDAKAIAFVQDNPSSLVVIPANGGPSRRIFSATNGHVYNLRWSPDGKSISFVRFDPDGADGTGAESLWSVAADGSSLQLLVPPKGAPSGTWMPDGKHFVFASSQDGKRDIWIVAKGGWMPHVQPRASRLTNGTLVLDAPLPSPDGKTIFAFGKQNLGQVVRYDKERNRFSAYLDGISANQIDFSRNGQWITYLSYPEETIWRSRVDGTDKQQLTFLPTSADSPHWSPDGQLIAYRAAQRGHTEKKIYLISRDGGAPQELFPDDKQEEGVPTWSPDGNQLVFGELRYHPDNIAIHIVNLNTREVTAVPSSQGLWTPRWSPDGRYLLALRANPSNFTSKGIFLYDFTKQKWVQLTDHPVSEIAWSHDGKYIYFDLCTKPETDALFRIRVRDGHLEQVVDLRAFPRSSGAGTGFSVAPDDSPLFLQEARQKEVYALEVR